MVLHEIYVDDPKLLKFYKKKLLEPGWAGLLSLEDAEYVRNRLQENAGLRRRWGIRRKIVPLSLIAEKAFPENPTAGRKHMKAEQAKARRRRLCVVKMSPVPNTVNKRGERLRPNQPAGQGNGFC